MSVELRCQVCGKTESVAKWRREYEEVHEGKEPAYICASCQAKIQAEVRSHPADD